MVIVDAQSVKNTDTAHIKGFDGGKNVSGIKRHIAVDSEGLLHAVGVTAANVGDRAGALEIIEKQRDSLRSVKKVLADSGYTGAPFADDIKKVIDAEVEVIKRPDVKKFVVVPKRWVVERSFAWLEKCRRLWKNCERLISSSIGMIHVAFIRLLLQRL